MDSGWVGESVDEDLDGNVDELFDSLGLNGESANVDRNGSGGDLGEPPRSKLWAPAAVALGLGFLVAAGAVVWLFQSRSDDNGAALETITTDGQAAGDVEAEAEKLRDILSGLSLDGVQTEVRDSKIFLTGSVATQEDVTSIRNAVISASDPSLVNMNEIVIGGPAYENQDAAAPAQAPPAGQQPPPPGQQPPPAAGEQPADGQAPPPPPPGGPPPGAPPPGFVPPTPEQRANLQAELNRVLTDTPLVFDPGSTSLNAVQLKLLDSTVIGLLEGHPGVPVRLVGYTDEQGDEFDNSLLSFARAEAVQAYLISRGVPPFILRVEGRGEENATGDAGADRRVEIEVIDGP